MELLQLRYFRSAAQYENFSKAAREYMIPQSSVSITISKLEEELGCKLFDRYGKKVVLNDNGRLFLRSVDLALTSLDNGISKLSPEKSSNIRLAIFAGSRLVPSLLTDFHKEYPNINFTLTQAAEDSDIPKHMDFSIMALPLPNAFMDYTILMEDEIQLAVPDNHPLSIRSGVRLEELKEESFIGFHTGKSMRRITDYYCGQKGFSPKVVLEAGDAGTFRGLIQNRMGIGFVPRKAWNSLPVSSVVLLPITDIICTRTLALCWWKDKKLSTSEKIFQKFAKQWYETL